jgi:phytanoyl-CoA hydroxylase
MDLKLDDDFLKSLNNNIAEAFKKRPKHIVGATYATKLQTLDELSINTTVKPGTRLYDAHSAIPELATLASHPSIHRMVTLLHNDVSVVTQSLYFPYGSMQPLHRDPWYVITTPVESMIACWIALEDIHPDSGPLSFVSDSHQLPYAPLLNTKDIIYHSPLATTESKSAHGRSMMKNVKAKGLEVKPFLAKKGQVFFWHSGLIHGGSQVVNPSLTRKSFVLHFDRLRYRPQKGTSYSSHGKSTVAYCDKVKVTDDCAQYFVSPIQCKSTVL